MLRGQRAPSGHHTMVVNPRPKNESASTPPWHSRPLRSTTVIRRSGPSNTPAAACKPAMRRHVTAAVAAMIASAEARALPEAGSATINAAVAAEVAITNAIAHRERRKASRIGGWVFMGIDCTRNQPDPAIGRTDDPRHAGLCAARASHVSTTVSGLSDMLSMR